MRHARLVTGALPLRRAAGISSGPLVCYVVVCACCFAVVATLGGRTVDQTAIEILCITFAVVVASALWTWWWVARTLFDPYALFLLSLTLFNGGQLLLQMVGLNPDGILGGRFSNEILLTSGTMALCGVAFCHIGALLAALWPVRVRPAPCSGSAHAQALRMAGWALLAVSIVPYMMLTRSAMQTRAAAGYMALYERGADKGTGVAAGPEALATFMIPAALLLLGGAQGRTREKYVALAVVFGAFATQIMLGYRSTAIMPLCAFAWLWNRCEGKIRLSVLIAAALALLTIIPFVNATRNSSLTEQSDARIEESSGAHHPFVEAIREMGGSLIATAYTVSLVPDVRPFDRGQSYFYALLTAMPNLFWDIHPSIARGTLSSWLIWTVDPYTARNHGGLGFACVAEAFLNFGVLGVCGVMALIGFGMGRMVTWATRSADLRALAMTATFSAFVLRLPRDESVSLLRMLLWYSWMPYALTYCIGAFAATPRMAPSRWRDALRFR